MLASVLIIVFSLALFVYWFRYTCLLILSARPARNYAGQVAAAHKLSFLAIQDKLIEAQPAELSQLHASIENDFQAVCRQLEAANPLQPAGDLEHLMLKFDYKLMQIVYSVGRFIAAPQAARALREMTYIVGFFANIAGERAAEASAAA